MNRHGTVVGLAAFALLAAGGCDDGPMTPAPRVRSVEVEPDSIELPTGSAAELDVFVDAKGGASREVRWSSTRGRVATVDSQGLVTGRDTGRTAVVATVDSTGTARGESAGSTDITVNVDYPDDLRCFADTARASAALEVVEP